jgi:hypothetical protein
MRGAGTSRNPGKPIEQTINVSADAWLNVNTSLVLARLEIARLQKVLSKLRHEREAFEKWAGL